MVRVLIDASDRSFGADCALEVKRGLRIDPLLAIKALLADIEEHFGRFIGKRRPIRVGFVEGQSEMCRHMAKWVTRDVSITEPEGLLEHVLQSLFALQIESRGFRVARACVGARALERVDLEAGEAFEKPLLDIGRNRHRRLHICGEDQIAHLGETAGKDLRVAEDMGT